MVKHVVFYRLKDYSKENCEALIAKFESMRGVIPQAKEVNAYADYLRSERSFDVMLEVILDSPKDLEDYQVNTYHKDDVKPYVQSIVSQSVSVDTEYEV